MANQWIEVKNLGEGGQGTVSLVKRAGEADPIETIVANISHLIHGNIEEKTKRFREQLAGALRVFVDGDYILGAKKQLRKPDEESKTRLARETEVYESISDPHLLKVLDKDLPANWIVTEYQPNGTLETQIHSYRADVSATLAAIRPLVNVLKSLANCLQISSKTPRKWMKPSQLKKISMTYTFSYTLSQTP